MVEIKTPGEIEAMAVTGAFIADLLDDLTRHAEVGVNLLDLEQRARELMAERGAVSCYWDYAPSFGRGPFRNVTCMSVNDGVLHGIPHDHRLADGDLLSIDIAVSIDGWVADAARSVIVGTARAEDRRLVTATEEALTAGIAAARPGGRLGDISAAIGAVAADHGYRVNTQFGGHGLGRTMHEDPHIPNAGRAGRGLRLSPGLTIAIEPWFTLGSERVVIDEVDGWTVRTVDGSRGAHSEDTIAITADGPLILTRPADRSHGHR